MENDGRSSFSDRQNLQKFRGITIRDALCRLEIKLSADDNSPLWMKCNNECVELRKRLEAEATEEEKGRRLRDGYSFWEISPSYRFDLLNSEIPWIADELAYAIAYMSIYLPYVQQDVTTRDRGPSMADFLFWYHADAGVRIASSCWERLGLLLDLAFDLELKNRCSFPAAIDKLADSEHTLKIAESEEFKQLEEIRNGEFQELEAGYGKGVRHETTHYLNMRTRFFHMELVEPWVSDEDVEDNSKNAAYWRDFLIEQHRLYIQGATAAIQMVARNSG